MRRLPALLRKELLDLTRNRTALLPVALVALLALVMPFVLTIALPAATGQSLGEDRDLLRISVAAGAAAALTDDGRVQAFLFEQFLLLFLLIPVTGAMALASHSVIGEKQGRTLEPLLAAPIGTTEFLVAKVLGALIPTLAMSLAGVLLYLICIGTFAEPGVLSAVLSVRSAMLIGVVGPAAALMALQLAVVISSRVNDARTAQQFGVLIILPLMALLIAQFTSTLWLTVQALALIGLGLLAVWILLVAVSVVLFDREAILTRWR
jgi:ABC-2 type transport system permease protein